MFYDVCDNKKGSVFEQKFYKFLINFIFEISGIEVV